METTTDRAPKATLMQQYRVEPELFWRALQMRGDTGYDSFEPAATYRWRPIGGWGRDGWDLGSWPLVIVYYRDRHFNLADGLFHFELCEYVEGDVSVAEFPTKELREQAIDELAFFHWKSQNEEWVDGIEKAEDAPDYLRGPYRSDR